MKKVSYAVLAALMLGHAAWAGDLSDRFSALFGDTDEAQILNPEQAFQPSLAITADHQLAARFSVVDGYYLYRDRFAFRLKEEGAGVLLGNATVPPGIEKEDPYFGTTEILVGDFSIPVELIFGSKRPETITVTMTYQGCKDHVVCYPPEDKQVTLALKTSAFSGAASAATAKSSSDFGRSDDALLETLHEKKYLFVVVFFFGLGLLLAFTPCVLPMVPILSGIIAGGERKRVGTRRAFFLSLTYVLAMAGTFSLLGLIIGAWSFSLQAFLQKPPVLIATSGLLLLLGAAMFGCFDIALPSVVEEKYLRLTQRVKGGQWLAAAAMGCLSSLVVSPCVTPPMVATLLYVAQSGDVWLGGGALFALGLGMGVPLLMFGTALGKWLPPAGAWMVRVKQFFALIIFVTALWIAARVMPLTLTLLGSGLLLVIGAFYVYSLGKPPEQEKPITLLAKGLAVTLLLYGAALIFYAARFEFSDKLLPESNTAPDGSASSLALPMSLSEQRFTPIASLSELRRVQASAAQQQRPLLLYFYADWCVACKELEHGALADVEVQRALDRFVLVRADVTTYNGKHRQLLAHFNLPGPPVMLLFGAGKPDQPAYRVVGVVDAKTLLVSLNKLGL